MDAGAAPADLNHPRSAKRRSAARRLRKLGAGDACGPLLDALRCELGDALTRLHEARDGTGASCAASLIGTRPSA